MRICFLVLAHHQPYVFHRLVSHICTPKTDIVVHIDKKSNIQEFYDNNFRNVHYLKPRQKVYWAGWSFTKTIFAMLEYGLKVSTADYFIFLAGTDFPIRPIKDLINYLGAHYPANFLNWYPLVPGAWGFHLIERYQIRRSVAAPFLNARNILDPGGPIMRKAAGRVVLKVEEILNSYLRPRDTAWMRFYSGSNRWCLNRDTVSFLVRYFGSQKSRALKSYLRLASNSDEIFIQTAILNSSHSRQCIGFDEDTAEEIFTGKRAPMPDEMRVYLHYIDWSPEREDPAILVESDLEDLKRSEKYFASKFIDGKSRGLLNKIERELFADTRHMAVR